MAAQTSDKKLDGAGLATLWGLIKAIIPTVPTNVSSFTNDAEYVSLLDSHNANLVLASPNGASGLPSFRALVAADIPDLSGTYLTSSSLNGYATQSWVTSQGFGTVSSIKVGDTSYSPSSGVVSLPAYPTSLPASDVYSWAKQSTKPSYSYSEISGTPSSLPANGGNADTVDNKHAYDFMARVIHASMTGDIPTDLEDGMHRIHRPGIEYSSVLAMHDYNGAYFQLYVHPTDGYDESIQFRSNNTGGVFRTIIDSNNIGSQSVNYANSAGSAPPYFANSTWYAVGDDSAIGDHDVGGTFCIKGLNATPAIKLFNSDNTEYATVIHTANYSNYALPLSGGWLSSSATGVLGINSTNAEAGIMFAKDSVTKGWVGYYGNRGMYMYNATRGNYLWYEDNGNLLFENNTVWHSGNDGSGSGLDADMLDGYHEYSFLRYRGSTATNGEGSLWNQIGIKDYENALPDGLSGVYPYGGCISLAGGNSRLDIYYPHPGTSYSDPYGIWVRTGWANDKASWKRLAFLDNVLQKIVVGSGATTDFNSLSDMTFVGRDDPSSGASLLNAPWSGAGPAGGFGVITHLFGYTYGFQLAVGYASNDVYIRYKSWDGTSIWNAWSKLALTTDNVASATRLQTSRTIWGQSFDGTANVNGDITLNSPDWDYGYGFHINEGGSADYGFDIMYGVDDKFTISRRDGSTTRTDIIQMYRSNDNVVFNGNVGIGTISPAQKLDVNGNVNMNGALTGCTSIDSILNFNTSLAALGIRNVESSDSESRPLIINGNTCICPTIAGKTTLNILGQMTLRATASTTYSMQFGAYSNTYEPFLNFYDYAGTGRQVLEIHTSTSTGGRAEEFYLGRGFGVYERDGNGNITLLGRTYIFGANIHFMVNDSTSSDSNARVQAMRMYVNGKTFVGTTTENTSFKNLNNKAGLSCALNAYTAQVCKLYIYKPYKDNDTNAAWFEYDSTNSSVKLNGSFYTTGSVGATAFTNTSDIRNKDFISDTSISIEQIANAPSFLFKWKTGNDRNVHAGSSAQYWNTVLPEIITTANDKQRTLLMQYDVIALLSSIAIAKEVVNDKEKIRQLEQRVSQLEAQLAN